MRQLAWLHALLERTKDEKPDAPQETRLAGLRRVYWTKEVDPEWLEMVSQQTYETLRDAWMPELPPIDWGGHLVAILMAAGPTVAAGMGAGPLDDLHLRAWQQNNTELTPFECQAVIRLSKEWRSEQDKACKHFAPAPWVPET